MSEGIIVSLVRLLAFFCLSFFKVVCVLSFIKGVVNAAYFDQVAEVGLTQVWFCFLFVLYVMLQCNFTFFLEKEVNFCFLSSTKKSSLFFYRVSLCLDMTVTFTIFRPC